MNTHVRNRKRRIAPALPTVLEPTLFQAVAESNAFLNVLVYQPAPNKLGAFIGGFDRPSLLKHMTGTFQNHKLYPVSCFGERLQFLQGSCFEFDVSADQSTLSLLGKDLARELTTFEPLPVLDGRPALKCQLNIDLPQNDNEFLFRLATRLGDERVNFSLFRFDRLLDRARLLHSNQSKVQLRACLELPKGLTPLHLEALLRDVCPDGASILITPPPSTGAFSSN